MPATSQLQNGRTVIPVSIRQQMDLRDGDQLIWVVSGSVMSATTRRDQLNKAQSKFKQLLSPSAVSIAEELIAERRKDANQK